MQRWCLGRCFLCSCDSAVRFLDSKNSSQPRLYCSVRRRAECTSLGPGLKPRLKHLSLRSDSSLAARRRAEALLHVILFFSTKHPSPARWAAALCTLVWYVATKDARWVRSSCSLGPSPRRPTSSCVWLRWGAATAFAHHGCNRSPTHRSLLVLLCALRPAAVSGRLCSVRFYLLKTDTILDLIIKRVESSNFGPKSDDLGHGILKSDSIPSDFAKSDCISRSILFADRIIKIRSSESDRIINGLSYVVIATNPRLLRQYCWQLAPLSSTSKPSCNCFGFIRTWGGVLCRVLLCRAPG